MGTETYCTYSNQNNLSDSDNHYTLICFTDADHHGVPSELSEHSQLHFAVCTNHPVIDYVLPCTAGVSSQNTLRSAGKEWNKSARLSGYSLIRMCASAECITNNSRDLEVDSGCILQYFVSEWLLACVSVSYAGVCSVYNGGNMLFLYGKLDASLS